MKRLLSTSVMVGLALLYGLQSSAAATEPTAPSSVGERPELVLQYDFAMIEEGQATDASGNGHDGQLVAAQIVVGKRSNAAQLDGNGVVRMAEVPATLDPKQRPLTIGAFCKPATPDGVLMAMGDQTNGFSLYLKGGVPQFAVRAGGKLFQVAASAPVVADLGVHLAGAIDAERMLWLVVNGWPVASTQGQLIADTPSEPFSVGADEGAPVGEYTAPLHWTGLVQDVRVYWGHLERTTNLEAWQDWADLPGCGCKK